MTDRKIRFLGLSLGGGKADKACLAVVDYYPAHGKVFLTKLYERIKNEASISADAKILSLIEQHADDTEFVAFDVPWRLPASLREAKGEPHLAWAEEHLARFNRQKKPKRLFSPYTQRCAELYLANELEEKFTINHAMGANTAPLLARAMWMQRRIDLPAIEVNPKVAVWRIGRSSNVMKSHLRVHRNSVGGDEARRAILQHLSENNVIFLYEQDRRLMVENNHGFEAFIVALTAFLKHKKRTETRPAGFPENEDWIEIPCADLDWKGL